MSGVNFGRYRVLLIPTGQKCDAEGKEIGDDWLLASLGHYEDGDVSGEAYVTTRNVRASDHDPPDAKETAFLLAAALSEAKP